jgi:hypothetical protein
MKAEEISMKYQKEEWRDVPNYGGVYQVSNLGRVKSLRFGKDKILSQGNIKSRRPSVGLRMEDKSKTFNVCQIVAFAFLNHKPSGHKLVVDHIDNNPFNNKLDNLQLITSRENISKDSWRRKKTDYPLGVRRYGVKKYAYESRIMIKGKYIYLGRFETPEEASKKYKEALSKLS